VTEPAATSTRWVLLLVVAAVAVTGPSGAEAATRVAVVGLGGLALVPLMGWLRALSFAPIVSAGAGAAVAAWLLGVGQAIPVAFLGASLAGAAVSGLLGTVWPARPEGAPAWISLLAAAAMWGSVLPRLTVQAAPQPVLFGIDLSAQRPLALLGVILLAGAAVSLGNVTRAQAGREMAAVGAAPELAMRSGAVVSAVRIRAGLLAGLFAGWAGLLLTLQAHALPPLASFSPGVAVIWIAVGVVGGMASVPGALLAAVLIGGAPLLGVPAAGAAGLALAAVAMWGGHGVLTAVRRPATTAGTEPA
jgi:ABC-type branched-subunit amino acid transport system permease subunit